MGEVWVAGYFTDADEFVDGYYATEHEEKDHVMVPEKTVAEIDAEKKAAETAEAERKAKEEKDKEDPRVKEAREEAIAERKKRQAAVEERAAVEAKLKEFEDAKKKAEKDDLEKRGETEKLLATERAERETERRSNAQKIAAAEQRIIQAELKTVALTAGIIDPRDIALADAKGVELDGDEVVGAKEAVEALKKDRPHLFKAVEATIKKDDKDTRTRQPGNATQSAEGTKGTDMTDAEFKQRVKDSPLFAGVQIA